MRKPAGQAAQGCATPLPDPRKILPLKISDKACSIRTFLVIAERQTHTTLDKGTMSAAIVENVPAQEASAPKSLGMRKNGTPIRPVSVIVRVRL